MKRNRERWIVLAILALGAVLRAAWLKSLAGTPYLSVPSLDAGYYLSWAESLAWGGSGGGAGFAGNPFYPYLLSLCLKIFGSIAPAARAAQAGLGLLTCLLAWKTGREAAGTAVGLAAAALCAGAGILIFYEAWLLPVALEVFCLAAAGAALVGAARTGSLGAWFAAGLAVGAGFLARGSLVPAAAVLAAALAPGRKARALAVLAAGTIVVPAVFFLRPGAGVPLVPAHSGENFYIGNRPGASGVGNIPEFARAVPELMHEDFRAEAVRRCGRPLNPAQSSAYWWREGLGFIGSRPFSFLGLVLKKIALFFSGGEYPDNYHPGFFRERWPPLGAVSWRLIAALGLAGMVAARDRKRFLPLYLLCASWVLGIALFFVVDRLRAPLVPALAVFGAETAAGAFRAFRQKRAAAAGARAALAAGFFLLLGVPGPGAGPGQFLLQAAEINYRAGEYPRAWALTERANAETPREEAGSPRWKQRLETARGKILLGLERYPEANRAFARALAGAETAVRRRDILLEAGNAYAAHRRWRAAAAAYRRAEALDPAYPPLANNLGLALKQLGDAAGAEAAFRAANRADETYAPALANLGNLALDRGDLDEAVSLYSRALALDPGMVKTRYALAFALTRMGCRDRAAREIDKLPPPLRERVLRFGR